MLVASAFALVGLWFARALPNEALGGPPEVAREEDRGAAAVEEPVTV